MTRLIDRWRSWTLLRQLVIGVSVVVMVVLVTVGTTSVLSLRGSVLGIIDAQLSGSADGFSQTVTKYRSTPDPSGKLPSPGAMKPLTHLIGQAPGNVIALIQDGKVVDSAYFVDGEARPARQDSAILPQTTEYSLARIEAEAHRMRSLVSDLLLLARLDEGRTSTPQRSTSPTWSSTRSTTQRCPRQTTTG
jgi:two-component system, OmpR family, sensor histidine kinase TrcS